MKVIIEIIKSPAFFDIALIFLAINALQFGNKLNKKYN